MPKEMPKAYEPQSYEDEIYKKWERAGYFNPDNLDNAPAGKHYAIAMPPPNVTGVLHLGHALENTIMDIQTRYKRMRGYKVLLVPGTDHAAVATQAKVEKILMKSGIKNPREELGREGLLAEVKKYAEESKATIIKQIKTMGTSCDWSRLAYTFDEKRSRAVNEVFVKMYNDGLIQKGYRVVNWSVKGQSTCSDDELEYEEQKTVLYTFRYSKDFPIAIATTRPETKLGDTAVAVHPADERHRQYVGQVFTADVGAAKPLRIKIIADKEIDPTFGTGAVGVTPAHSQADYEMYLRHNLELLPVIGTDGRMTASAGANYAGKDILEAREAFAGYLRANGLMEKEEEITHNIGKSDRFGDVVEIIPMEQWFVMVNKEIPDRGKTLKDLMREAVTTGLNGDKNKIVAITPERFLDAYLKWIDNLRDWCISRQIWWGHRIPVWYQDKNGQAQNFNNQLANNLKTDEQKYEIYVGADAPADPGWVQDEDSLDTWFSSGLWTFSTLGWPEQSEDLKNFHPTAWMQMGYELLFFWMARMILMSTYVLNDVPFKEAYIHGILRDKNGRKFSKSLGNGIDPILVSKQYGTDGLRLSLILGNTPGNDSRFYEEKTEAARNMVNKLWNVARYSIMNYELKEADADLDKEELSAADKWILVKMKNLVIEASADLESYKFSQAGERLRDFTWNDLADWYIEAAKFEKNGAKDKVIGIILRDLLKLWHPFIPFVSEAIWQELGREKDLIISPWPEQEAYDNLEINQDEANDFEIIKDIISAIRNARAENKVEPARKTSAVIIAGKHADLIKNNENLIMKMRTGVEKIELSEETEDENIAPEEDAIKIAVREIIIYLPGAIDKEKEAARIMKEKANLEKQIAVLKGKLMNQDFTERAPEAIVAQEKDRLKKMENELQNLE